MNSSVMSYTAIDTMTEEHLVVHYAPTVKRIACHLMGRLPKHVQLEDLIQAGMMGLLEASSKYDVSKGASFETYAGIRIRGMMLDEVRKNDWVPRSVYRNSRRVTEAIQTLEHKLGRDSNDTEVADALGVSLDEYHRILQDVNSAQVLGFDDLDTLGNPFSEQIPSSLSEPYDSVQKEEFLYLLAALIQQLPEREKLVLSLYYDQELNLKEIGQILEVSESRICQIHAQAMHRLRARLQDIGAS